MTATLHRVSIGTHIVGLPRPQAEIGTNVRIFLNRVAMKLPFVRVAVWALYRIS